MSEQLVSLDSLANGAAVERFDYELQRVLENISDINTRADAMREVTLKVKIKPNDDRSFAMVEIIASSKLAPVKPEATSFHLNGARATEFNPKQQTIFDKKEV